MPPISKSSRSIKPPTPNTGNTYRDRCITLIYNALNRGQITKTQGAINHPHKLAVNVERYIYQLHNFTVSKGYKDCIRSKIWNLNDKKNPALRENLINNIFSAEEFARMSSEEMASRERQLQNILSRQSSLKASIGVVDLKPMKWEDGDLGEPTTCLTLGQSFDLPIWDPTGISYMPR
ncbi:hypothetical protein G9A89_003566 [Geosiphon pyriformis]|nr:hypothetical protein G9A89_003566 [Geosiphon pyriformis]